ncbi:MAG: hypothetical protein IKB28_03370 [Clostridia bacterium]|nr:hypothetical protein [Clostridia bacterium]
MSLNNNNKKKDHYKKKDSGIYGKINKPLGKSKRSYKISKPVQPKPAPSEAKEKKKAKLLEEKALQAQQEALQAQEQQTSEKKADHAFQFGTKQAVKPEKKPKESASPEASRNMMFQLLSALLLTGIGAILLLATTFVVYQPIQKENKSLSETRLKTRMELSALISEVLPSMGADDELGEMILRSLETQKAKFKGESVKVADEIEQLRDTDEIIGGFLTEISYGDADFHDVIVTPEQSEACLQTINGRVEAVDAQLQELGVADIKAQIDELKGTTTTTTREDENGETITETVVTGGLIPEVQAKRDTLKKQADEAIAKRDDLDNYLGEINYKIQQMYLRLETDGSASDKFAWMKEITEYIKQNPTDNIFMQDTADKLASFPGESREEDDILFLAKIESETGIRMPTINYGQDYQLTKLSNGMLLCYEAYSIPYYATYQGLKNLIAYFNENDDFYASVYTLTIQYNPQNESIQGNIIILHYYLLSEDAEYIPPVIDEEISNKLESIFGAATDNGKFGPMSDYTPEEIEAWMDDEGLTLEQVRDRLKSQGYPETELLWILKKKYNNEDKVKEFLEKYGDDSKDYNDQLEMFSYLQELFPNTKFETLLAIYKAELPEDDLENIDPPVVPEETPEEQPEGDQPAEEQTPSEE